MEVIYFQSNCTFVQVISLDAILFHNGEHKNPRHHKKIMLAREKGTYARIREKGKAGGRKGKGKGHDRRFG